MLDYTKMAIKQTISDLKKTDYIRNVATQIIYIIYLIYTLIVRSGYLALNIVLLVLATSYFVFFLTVTSVGKTPEGKNVKSMGTKVYVWCKRLIKLFTLGLTLYGICTAVKNVTAVSVVLAALMIVGWILQIVFEVLIKILTNRVNFILEGLEADLDNMLKPVRSVGNFFKKVTGKEVAPPKEMTKNQLRLKEKVEAYRAEQKRKKAEEKIRREVERLAAKETAKEQKQGEKQSRRIETRLLRGADKKRRAEEKEALRASRKALPAGDKEFADSSALTEAQTAETALALSENAEKSSGNRKKLSIFSRLKNKFTGTAGELSPEQEVFEANDEASENGDDHSTYEEPEEDCSDLIDSADTSEDDPLTQEPESGFFDEDTIPYLEGEEDFEPEEEEPSEDSEEDEQASVKKSNKLKNFFGSVFGKKKQ